MAATMPFRRWVLLTHKWLGVAFSALLGLLGLTGAMLVLPEDTPSRWTAGVLHDSLMLGRPGWVLVVLATGAAIALQAGGLVLWWRSRSLRIRRRAGLWRFAFDLHGAFGALGFVVMLILAVSGLARALLPYLLAGGAESRIRELFSRLHTTEGFPLALQVVFAIGSLGFVVQAVTGLIVWWRPARRTARSAGA